MNRKSIQKSREEDVPRFYPSLWSEFRRSELFADCELVSSDGVVFRSHKVLLATASEYFKVALLHSENHRLSIPFPAALLGAVLDFVYTGEAALTCENVQELLPTADHLCIFPLIDKCCEFIGSQATPHNAWRIHKFASFFSCTSLAKDSKNIVLVHFEEFFNGQEEFLEMAPTDLKAVLLDDRLNVKRENQVLTAIALWVQSNLDARKAEANGLLQAVRWGYVCEDFFISWMDSLFFKEEISQTILDTAFKAIQHYKNRFTQGVPRSYAFRPRIPHTLLFSTGGWSCHITDTMSTYDIRCDKWLNVEGTKLKMPMAYHAMVCVDNIIYVLGGYDGRTHLNSLVSFDPISRNWNRKANMYFPRCYLCAVVLDNEIYAIGGCAGHNRLKCVEKYDIATNQWRFVASMNARRSDAAAISHDRRIFVFGGCDGDSALWSVEMYDPQTNCWTPLERMSTPRRGLSVCLYEGWIHVLGGADEAQVLATCERFSPELLLWERGLPRLWTARSNFCAVVLEGRLMVLGGYNGCHTIRKTEWFDGARWLQGRPLRGRRSAMAVCLCSGLPNASEYSFISRM